MPKAKKKSQRQDKDKESEEETGELSSSSSESNSDTSSDTSSESSSESGGEAETSQPRDDLGPPTNENALDVFYKTRKRVDAREVTCVINKKTISFFFNTM